MRALALAAAIGVGLVATAAYAGPWSDPAGRVNFTAPNGWVTDVRRDNPQTIVLSGNANNECYVLGTPNPNTASNTPIALKRATNPITPEAWTATANAISPMFPNHNAHLETQTVDTTTGFWPIQRATFSGGEQPVMAALTSRPGVDLIAFCWTYGGPDATATYERLFASLGNNNDAQWQQRAEQQETEQAAAQAAAAAAAAQQPATQAQQPNQAAEPPRTMNDPRSRRRHN
ncbi:hypothetical protein [Terricaulis sp.]|uniref:hypothetical protein n=1 Tax=Terricaulis sp. TaxID=2768686 RepID=UPI0037831E1D